MRRVHKVLFAISLAAVAFLIVALAMPRAPEPEPYVRLYDTRVGQTYLTRIECVDGVELQTYARSDGSELAPVLTDRPCDASAHRP